jgi:hypothetical protein
VREVTENTVRKAFQYCADKRGYSVESEMRYFDLWLLQLKANIYEEARNDFYAFPDQYNPYRKETQ